MGGWSKMSVLVDSVCSSAWACSLWNGRSLKGKGKKRRSIVYIFEAVLLCCVNGFVKICSCSNVVSWRWNYLQFFYSWVDWIVDCKNMLYTDLVSSQALRIGLELTIQTPAFGYNHKQLEHTNQPVIAHNIRTSLSHSLGFSMSQTFNQTGSQE